MGCAAGFAARCRACVRRPSLPPTRLRREPRPLADRGVRERRGRRAAKREALGPTARELALDQHVAQRGGDRHAPLTGASLWLDGAARLWIPGALDPDYAACEVHVLPA